MIRLVVLGLAILAASGANAQSVSAVLEPARAVELRSTVNGRVVSVIEQEGTVVSEGAVVAEMDASVQRARVALAEVGAAASGLVLRAEKIVEQAEFRLDRLKAARAKGAAQAWEVTAAEQGVAIARADLVAAQDDVNRREAELGLEQATLSEFIVRSPFQATVLEVLVGPGEIVDTATVLLELGQLETLTATAFVPLDWIDALAVGKSIEAQVEARGTVEALTLSIDPRVDPGSRTQRVVIEVANPEGALRPGEILLLAPPG